MTATFERSYFVQHGTEDDSAKARQAKEAERERHDRLAAVRVIAGLATDATEARALYAMLGLGEAEVREARRPIAAVTTVGPATAAASTTSRRRGTGKVTAA